MSRILITGCNGQLGSDCLDVFRDDDVVGVDLPQVDLSDRAACFDFLAQVRPNTIVNCAAFTAVDACETDPSCWKGNRDLPAHLAEWSNEQDVFLAHVSTDYVFDGNKPLYEACLETDDPCPVSVYGKSKLAGEKAIEVRAGRSAILRTAWLYGATGKNFLKTMLRLTLNHPGKPFKVVSDQWGSPTWSRSLAQQIRAVVEANAVGIFHASSEGYCTWYDLACAFLDRLGVEHNFVPCSSEEFPTPTKRPANSILENAHLKELDINVFSDWKDELERFVQLHGDAILKHAQNEGLSK